MKRKIQILSLIAAAFVMSLAVSAQTRVNFAPGATSKVMTGRMYSFKSERVYLIRVKRGQTMWIEQVGGGSHTITISEILDPNGNDVNDMDASCNNRKKVAPTKRGDYRVTVRECQKVDPWRGRYRLRFKVTGRGY